jgi:glycosyltransferase involved in cell wall biosynthesis
VPTQELAQTLAAAGYRELRVVGRGVDTALFSPVRRSVPLRARWGCLGDEPVAIHVGRLAPEKGLDLFVAAALAARKADQRTRVVLVGDGPAGRVLRARHPDFLFAGMRHGTDLAAHYASADLLLFPSTTETFGNVTTEALASGLAVCAFDYAAARQHIRHDVSGLLAAPGDRDTFIANAARLAGEPGLRARLRASASALGATLSWDRIVDDLESVFCDVIERRRRGPSPAVGIARRPARSDRAAS